jgi:hypothetical protein
LPMATKERQTTPNLTSPGDDVTTAELRALMSNLVFPKDETIEDVLSDLTSPEAYVRGIFGHLSECRVKHGNAFVRIAAAEHSSVPDYRISYRCEPDSPEFVFGSYYGRDHSAIKVPSGSSNRWNSKVITADEIQNILGKIHGWKGRRR